MTSSEKLAQILDGQLGESLIKSIHENSAKLIESIANESGVPKDSVMMFVGNAVLVDGLMGVCVASGLNEEQSRSIIREVWELLATLLERCVADPSSN